MPPKLALVVYFTFIVWLFRHATRRGWSKELWIPLIWILIVGSKPIGLWLALLTGTSRDAEGSNLDTAIFLGLLAAGCRVLTKRNINWNIVLAKNKWLFLYFAYAAISVLWSDRPLGSFKMWVKDAGNVIIVLVLLSQSPVGEGVRTTLARAAYVLIPLSTLLVKYFPDLGRGYDPWTWQPLMVGANESKNALGATITLCSLGLLWSMFDRQKNSVITKSRFFGGLLMIVATTWLLLASSCATALACTITALILMFLLRKQILRTWLTQIGISAFVVVPLLLLFVNFVLDLDQAVVGNLGRDMTLTGRTPIWRACLAAPINPFFGSGYVSFWNEQGPSISQQLGFYFTLKEAHNGYIETYLNLGLIGLTLLVGAVSSSLARTLKGLGNGGWYPALRLVFIVVGLLYNFTESAFAGLNSIWLLLLLATVEYPHPVLRQSERTASVGERFPMGPHVSPPLVGVPM